LRPQDSGARPGASRLAQLPGSAGKVGTLRLRSQAPGRQIHGPRTGSPRAYHWLPPRVSLSVRLGGGPVLPFYFALHSRWSRRRAFYRTHTEFCRFGRCRLGNQFLLAAVLSAEVGGWFALARVHGAGGQMAVHLTGVLRRLARQAAPVHRHAEG